MAEKKIIAVTGVAGRQGVAVARTFLRDPKLKNEWDVRAITSDMTSEYVKSLQGEGAEVVAADMNNKESLVDAMKGSAVVFAVTDYWDKMDMQLEIQQGKNLVDAAEEAGGINHFIWSSAPNARELSHGSLPHVYHLDSKAKVEEYARTSDLPCTFFLPGFYMGNVFNGMIRQLPPDNEFFLSLPVPGNTPIPFFDPADSGKYVKAIVRHRDRLLGERVYAATEYLTVEEVVAVFRRAYPNAGLAATYREISPALHVAGFKKSGRLPHYAAVEMLENVQMLDRVGFYGGMSLAATHALVEDRLTTLEEFLSGKPPEPQKELRLEEPREELSDESD